MSRKVYREEGSSQAVTEALPQGERFQHPGKEPYPCLFAAQPSLTGQMREDQWTYEAPRILTAVNIPSPLNRWRPG